MMKPTLNLIVAIIFCKSFIFAKENPKVRFLSSSVSELIKSKESTPRDEFLKILNEVDKGFTSYKGDIGLIDTLNNVKIYKVTNFLESTSAQLHEDCNTFPTKKALIFFYDYSDTETLFVANTYLTALLEILSARVKNGVSKANEYEEENGNGVTYITDLFGNPLVKIESGKEWGLSITFYSNYKS